MLPIVSEQVEAEKVSIYDERELAKQPIVGLRLVNTTKLHLMQEVQVVGQEQERIRQNMPQLERTSDLSARYVQKFATQEERVETLRKEIAGLQAREIDATKSLDKVPRRHAPEARPRMNEHARVNSRG